MKILNKIALATAFTFAATASNAAVITFTDNDNGLEKTEISQTLELGLFDSTLGTLESVALSLSATANTAYSLTNNAAQSQNVSAKFDINLFVTPDFGPITFTNPELVLTLVDTLGFITLASGETQSFDNAGVTETTNFNFTSGTDDLSAFLAVGGGALDFACNTISGITLTGGGGNVSSTQSTNAGCEAEITYTYSTTPPPTGVSAPASVLFLGMSLGALGLRRKFK